MTPQQARSRLNKAVRCGEVVRRPCEVCGATKKVHAHHDDYEKPLDVRWLCPSHHHEAHGKTAGGSHKRKRYEGYNPEKTILIKPPSRTTVEKLYPKRKKWPKWWLELCN